MSETELGPYRQLGDGEIDTILRTLELEGRPLGPTEDLLVLAEEARKVSSCKRTDSQKLLAAFEEKYSSLPGWVDKDQLERGQGVFLAYAPVAGLSLYYRSLIAGFSIPKIAAVIRATAYLSPPSRPDQALQRLFDTGELTASCIGIGIDALLPGGLGWKTALHVRVLHAKVRAALLRRSGRRRWDCDKYGIPINQEDMSGTLLAFSVNVLDGIDLLAGVALAVEERNDYLALWRYIGWLLGVETETPIRAKSEASTRHLPPLDPCGPGASLTKRNVASERSAALLQSILFHLMDPDETSVEVAHHLLKITDRTPPSFTKSEIPDDFYMNDLFYLRALNCRLLIGNPLADALKLPLHPNRWKRFSIWLKSSLTLSMLRWYTLLAMFVPFVRRRMIRWHAYGMFSFHENWRKTHRSRMSKALESKELASCLDGKNEEKGGMVETQSSAPTISICPFAMITRTD